MAQSANRNTKNKLIETAITLTARYGIENVTVRKISDEMDISEATLYRHFNSRDELLSNCFLIIDERVSGLYLNSPHLSEVYDSFFENLRLIWLDIYRYLLEHKEETLFLLKFRYSSLYTEDVRNRRKSYDGSFDQAFTVMEKLLGDNSNLYRGFLPNYLFELTMCFAEKIISGRVPDNDETTQRLWSIIKVACMYLTAK